MSLIVEDLQVHAGRFSLPSISFTIPTGQCGVLMGPSGSGKTTLMEALCGLRKVSAGRIELGGRRIDTLRPGARRMGLVPQDTVLFPHLKVRDHLAFGPQLQGWTSSDIASRVDELARALHIFELLDRKPKGLSGGEAKRVAIGRAIAGKPQLLCLDEALTGLDEETHQATMGVLQQVIKEEEITTLYITHRADEASQVGDVMINWLAAGGKDDDEK